MMSIFNKLLLLIFLLSSLTLSQNSELGSWNILNLKYKLSDLSYFFETQLRSLRFYKHYHYYEFKGGVEYPAYENVKLALAAGNYQTYREGGNFLLPKNNNELRIWPQIILLQPINKIKIEQRYRIEFRFTSNGFRNRFRYRFALLHRFNLTKDINKPFQVSVSNEIFIGDRAPYFERNRLLIALNYSVTDWMAMQIGYLRQFDYKINDEIGRNFLQIGLLFEIFKNSQAYPDKEIQTSE